MDKYFGRRNPKYPAQSASVRIVCYKEFATFKLAAQLENLFQTAFSRTHALGRLHIEFDLRDQEELEMSSSDI